MINASWPYNKCIESIARSYKVWPYTYSMLLPAQLCHAYCFSFLPNLLLTVKSRASAPPSLLREISNMRPVLSSHHFHCFHLSNECEWKQGMHAYSIKHFIRSTGVHFVFLAAHPRPPSILIHDRARAPLQILSDYLSPWEWCLLRILRYSVKTRSNEVMRTLEWFH